MTGLSHHLRWKEFPIPATSAFGTVPLRVGQVGESGPTCLITAGLHGDEGPWGALAIRKLIDRIDPDELRGTIRIVPAANPLAMQADLRNAPVDQLDLNRAFPGNVSGSYTERVAYTLSEYALHGADAVIDLHGGGSWCVNSFVFSMEGGEHLAACFEAPFVVNAPDRTVTLTGYARSVGAVVTAVEMGGRSPFEIDWAERITRGLFRALTLLGIIAPQEPLAPVSVPALPVSGTDVLRPSSGGVFVPALRADSVGTVVPQDTLLGRLHDPVTFEVIEEFRAPHPQTAILLLRPAVAQLEGGAMTYVISTVST